MFGWKSGALPETEMYPRFSCQKPDGGGGELVLEFPGCVPDFGLHSVSFPIYETEVGWASYFGEKNRVFA